MIQRHSCYDYVCRMLPCMQRNAAADCRVSCHQSTHDLHSDTVHVHGEWQLDREKNHKLREYIAEQIDTVSLLDLIKVTCTYVFVFVFVFVCVCVCLRKHVPACLCITYTRTYIHTCKYTCTHIHIQVSTDLAAVYAYTHKFCLSRFYVQDLHKHTQKLL